MIKVDRGRISRPKVLSLDDPKSPAHRELERAHDFFTGRTDRGQRRFDFKVFANPEVRAALKELFHGKCAYCERRVESIDIELFRPKASVLERPEHPGYWWLAAVWENMLPACADCNRVRAIEGVKTGKANRFPIADETQRAFHPGEETREQPLLLDPCVDDPEEHLVYGEDGKVFSETERGQATIAVIGLNRPALVEVRRETAHRIRQWIASIRLISDFGVVMEEIHELLEPSEEFAALKRQLVAPLLADLNASTPKPGLTKTRTKRAKAAFAKFEHAQSSYSLNDEEGRAKYRGQRRLIESIRIEDVKAIRSLALDFTGASGRTPWLMLLGENGTGKSTVLQCTALALLGAHALVKLAETREVRPADFIRFQRKKGSVSVKLSGFPKSHTLVFFPNRVEFTSPTDEKTTIVFDGPTPRIEGSGWEPQTLLLGYGATRLLPRASMQEPEAAIDAFSSVDNLFDPFVPLLDAERWLSKLDKGTFDITAMILKDLLALDPDASLTREQDRVMVVANRTRTPLRRLSDGYQSVIAMTVDLLEVALRLWPNLQEAEGTVLLDEVGAHLHPTWKMQIVGALRRALPAMQFLATTHDPLCLRGLGNGEVAVLRRADDGQVISVTGLPSPADFRVDQLLTSDFFGLNSTVDPDVEAIFDEYYALLALKAPTPGQETRLAELRNELDGRRHLGTTLRENLMYEAVDRLVAQHRVAPTVPLAELQEQAVLEVAKIWNEAPGKAAS